jgi:hypothetical protein
MTYLEKLKQVINKYPRLLLINIVSTVQSYRFYMKSDLRVYKRYFNKAGEILVTDNDEIEEYCKYYLRTEYVKNHIKNHIMQELFENYVRNQDLSFLCNKDLLTDDELIIKDIIE